MHYPCRLLADSLPFALACCALLVAQENVAKQPAADPAQLKADADQPTAERFQTLYRQWNALDKQMNETQQRHAAAAPAARDEIKKQFTELVDLATELLPRLRAAAEAAYTAAPNKDADVLRTLIGMVAYDYRRDYYDSALELAALLDEHKCPEPALYNVAGAAAFNTDDYVAAEKYLDVAAKAGRLDEQSKEMQSALAEQKKAWAAEVELRTKEAAADDLPRVKLETTKGTIVVELFENEAPQTVGNFISLVEQKFYDGVAFHRVLPGFMAQGGDPKGDGSGGPGYTIYCECTKENHRKHFRGSLSMAKTPAPNTGGSQFFLTFRPTTHLNGQHTVFGRVIEGLDVLAKLQRRDPNRAGQPDPDKIVKAEVLRKRDHKYEPTKVVE